MSELLPTVQAGEIQDGLLDYLTTTFALADPGAQLALALRPLCNDIGWKFSVGTEDDDLVLYPQFPLARFRYDFAVVAKWKARPLVLIECDGKDFHSSADQQANDKLKDDAAANAGIRLLRFTGSEINSDVDACVRYALSAMLKAAIQ